MGERYASMEPIVCLGTFIFSIQCFSDIFVLVALLILLNYLFLGMQRTCSVLI